MLIESLLDSFNLWASQELLEEKNVVRHDHRTLLSGHNFELGAIGYAVVAGMCLNEYSSSIVQSISYDGLFLSSEMIGSTMAHEVGHSLGMEHDDQDLPSDECYKFGYIMQPAVVNGRSPTVFSQCSLDAYHFYAAKFVCLTNDPPLPWWPSLGSVCGDGRIEGEEHCDCGNDMACPEDPCCDGQVCRLKEGADCSASFPCCHNCTLKALGEVCYPLLHPECDLPELCDGVSSACTEANEVVAPGEACTDESHIHNSSTTTGGGTTSGTAAAGKCYNGLCVTSLAQCRYFGENWESCTIPLAATTTEGGKSDNDDAQNLYCSQLSCWLPPLQEEGEEESCNIARGPVLDGTDCGEGKQCLTGLCQKSSLLSFVGLDPSQPTLVPPKTKTITEEKVIFGIPVSDFVLYVVVGLLLCTLLTGLLYWNEERKKKKKGQRATSQRVVPLEMILEEKGERTIATA